MAKKTQKNEIKHKSNKKTNRKSNKNNRRIRHKKTYRAGGIFDISAQALQTNATIRTLESMASPGTIKKLTNSKNDTKQTSDYKIVKVEKNGKYKYYKVPSAYKIIKVKKNGKYKYFKVPIQKTNQSNKSSQHTQSTLSTLSRVITAIN
jgi:hypothetical protein